LKISFPSKTLNKINGFLAIRLSVSVGDCRLKWTESPLKPEQKPEQMA